AARLVPPRRSSDGVVLPGPWPVPRLVHHTAPVPPVMGGVAGDGDVGEASGNARPSTSPTILAEQERPFGSPVVDREALLPCQAIVPQSVVLALGVEPVERGDQPPSFGVDLDEPVGPLSSARSSASTAPPPPSGTSSLPGVPVTNCQQPLLAVVVHPNGDSRCQRATCREVSSGPPVPCAFVPRPSPAGYRGKGAKYASLCPGPWVSALQRMPPLPLTGAKRARVGLSDTPLCLTEVRRVRAERSARALVALLPHMAVRFIIHDPAATVDATPPEVVAERLTSVCFPPPACRRSTPRRRCSGASLDRCTEATRKRARCHDRTSTTSSPHTVWLRDWCGLDLPARRAAIHPHRASNIGRSHDKESFSLHMAVGLETLAACRPSPFVRGHAAGWLFLARAALRVEQSSDCVINAVVSHPYAGRSFTLMCAASIGRDKNPNLARQRPRPLWSISDGILYPEAPLQALGAMLAGAEEVRCVLRDTDSPSVDPVGASAWVCAPLSGNARVDSPLQSLLCLPPMSLSREAASRYHGHAAKRFLLNVAEVSPHVSALKAQEVGRFSQSTAHHSDLEPVEAMLRRHTLNASVLPEIYVGRAKVSKVLDTLAHLHVVQLEGGWAADGLVAPAAPSEEARLLTHSLARLPADVHE
ncbi:MAG: hypothetical protein SGPRY_003440, partial [Prymnesium sp.]